MVDIVALIASHCQSQHLNVVAAVPEAAVRPIARLQEIGTFGPSTQMPDHLWEFDVQADVWAETKADAQELVGAINTVLRQLPANQHGVLTRAQMVNLDYQPDESWPADGQPGPRYISIIRVVAHP